MYAFKLCYRGVRAKPVSGKTDPVHGLNKRTLSFVEGIKYFPRPPAPDFLSPANPHLIWAHTPIALQQGNCSMLGWSRDDGELGREGGG